jgi:hypothetical protein
MAIVAADRLQHQLQICHRAAAGRGRGEHRNLRTQVVEQRARQRRLLNTDYEDAYPGLEPAADGSRTVVRRYWTFFRKIPRNAPSRRNEEVTF